MTQLRRRNRWNDEETDGGLFGLHDHHALAGALSGGGAMMRAGIVVLAVVCLAVAYFYAQEVLVEG